MTMKTLHAALLGIGASAAMASVPETPVAGEPRFQATHEFIVEAPPGEVFPLFLPDGESRWAPSWQPVPVVPDTIRAEKNAVFLTGPEDERIVWTVVDFDHDARSIEYLVVDAGFQQRWIKVRCRGSGNRSIVSVTYVTTALSEAGAEALRRYDREFIRQWEEPVRQAVAAGR